jgi:Domain of unknown function (DUF4258)
MKLEFTNNALARMLDREIRQADILAAIESPEQLVPCMEKCWHARKSFGARTLEVILTRDLLQTQIITAYWQESK